MPLSHLFITHLYQGRLCPIKPLNTQILLERPSRRTTTKIGFWSHTEPGSDLTGAPSLDRTTRLPTKVRRFYNGHGKVVMIEAIKESGVTKSPSGGSIETPLGESREETERKGGLHGAGNEAAELTSDEGEQSVRACFISCLTLTEA